MLPQLSIDYIQSCCGKGLRMESRTRSHPISIRRIPIRIRQNGLDLDRPGCLCGVWAGKKWFKIDFLHGVVIKNESNPIFLGLRCRVDVDKVAVHFSLLAIRSDVMGLCSTKKPIHLESFSSGFAQAVANMGDILLSPCVASTSAQTKESGGNLNVT